MFILHRRCVSCSCCLCISTRRLEKPPSAAASIEQLSLEWLNKKQHIDLRAREGNYGHMKNLARRLIVSADTALALMQGVYHFFLFSVIHRCHTTAGWMWSAGQTVWRATVQEQTAFGSELSMSLRRWTWSPRCCFCRSSVNCFIIKTSENVLWYTWVHIREYIAWGNDDAVETTWDWVTEVGGTRRDGARTAGTEPRRTSQDGSRNPGTAPQKRMHLHVAYIHDTSNCTVDMIDNSVIT